MSFVCFVLIILISCGRKERVVHAAANNPIVVIQFDHMFEPPPQSRFRATSARSSLSYVICRNSAEVFNHFSLNIFLARLSVLYLFYQVFMTSKKKPIGSVLSVGCYSGCAGLNPSVNPVPYSFAVCSVRLHLQASRYHRFHRDIQPLLSVRSVSSFGRGGRASLLRTCRLLQTQRCRWWRPSSVRENS